MAVLGIHMHVQMQYRMNAARCRENGCQENGCPWDEETCADAPWNDETCFMAESIGQLVILRWALQNGCPQRMKR